MENYGWQVDLGLGNLSDLSLKFGWEDQIWMNGWVRKGRRGWWILCGVCWIEGTCEIFSYRYLGSSLLIMCVKLRKDVCCKEEFGSHWPINETEWSRSSHYVDSKMERAWVRSWETQLSGNVLEERTLEFWISINYPQYPWVDPLRSNFWSTTRDLNSLPNVSATITDDSKAGCLTQAGSSESLQRVFRIGAEGGI